MTERRPAPDWLPRGRALSARDVAWRHRVVCGLLALHLPALLVLGAADDDHRSALAAALPLVPVTALLGVALASVPRRVGALSATGGLLLCTAQLAGGGAEVQVHGLVVVAGVALYQDWVAFAASVCGAVGGVALGHVVLGDAADWRLTAVSVAAVLAEAALLTQFWRADEQARSGQEQLEVALREEQSCVQARLEETERIRRDLIGTVSHEFRTPLTGIRGAALTLLKRGDRLDRARRDALLHAVLDQQERLSRLLENMLTASAATATDPQAVTDVHAVVVEVVMLARAARPGSPDISVLVEPGTTARIDRQALHQVLANLVDNAQVHGAPPAVPLLAGGRDARGAWVAVSNDGSTMDEADVQRLFEPFAQADAGATREHEGLGMGLYVVKRLVEVHGGEVQVRSEGGWVTVEVRLPAVDPAGSDDEAPALTS